MAKINTTPDDLVSSITGCKPKATSSPNDNLKQKVETMAKQENTDQQLYEKFPEMFKRVNGGLNEPQNVAIKLDKELYDKLNDIINDAQKAGMRGASLSAFLRQVVIQWANENL